MRSLYVILIFISILSCQKYKAPLELEKILIYAANNRIELEKVLKHYAKDKKDEKKYDAACYLISNMLGHGANYLKDPEKFDPVFKSIGKEILKNDLKRAKWDSVNYLFTSINNKIEYRDDVKHISAKFLIDNIDNAFYAWQKFPWCKKLTYEEFKKYILPYRSLDEPLDLPRSFFIKKYSWVIDSLDDKNDMAEAFALIYNEFNTWFETSGGIQYPIPLSFTQALSAKGGQCGDGCNLLAAIMRAMGIRSAIDISVDWGNRKNAEHRWVPYVPDDSTTFFIDRDNILKKTKYIHSGKFPVNKPAGKYLPKDIDYQTIKKGTKVKRVTFEYNAESIFLNNKTNEEIPKRINTIFNIDVTQQYITCKNVELKLKHKIDRSFVYLCVFSLNGFSPIEGGLVKSNKVVFKSMGINVIYFPTIFMNNSYVLVAKPFHLNQNGDKEYIVANTKNTQKLIIKRKYPLFANILNYANRMYYGKFQGSNREDFADSIDLFTIKNTYLIPFTANISNTTKFRYLRYIANDTTYGDIAELVFYGNINGDGNKIDGEKIYKYEGPFKKTHEKAFDNNYDSYYIGTKKGTWIGIDLGKGNEKQVGSVKFCPRTDTNFIMPGKDYELYYWDNYWISLGRKTATDYFLEYNNAPLGALFWLHCHSGGSEERPFTYENGKQVWW